MVANVKNRTGAAIVAAVRTPMVKAGDALRDEHVTNLAAAAFQEAMHRAALSGDQLDEVLLGNVVMPADATNPARIAALKAGAPEHVPALTVQRNCASGMEAIGQAALRIRHGEAKTILAGGAESMSTVPLLFPLETLAPMMRLAKAKTFGAKMAALSTLRPRHFKPTSALLVGLTDPSCGLIMGKTAEVLAHEFAIGREAQDAFALGSHQKAVAAIEAGRFADHMVTYYAGKRFSPVNSDVGPRSNQTLAALAKLRPIFDRRDGSVTVGNACQITDGAAAALLMDTLHARAQGRDVLGYVRAYSVAALDPSRMGLGPVFAIDKLLQKTGMTLNDIDLVEINEAFAVQVLACLRAMADDAFCQKHLGRSSAIGELDEARLNVNGGAIALGHPVGATGARLVVDLLHEMRRRQVQWGVASLCVGGGQGAAVLLEAA